jgi:hypothetical protein
LDFLSVDLRVRPEDIQERLGVNPLAMRNRRELLHTFPSNEECDSASRVRLD